MLACEFKCFPIIAAAVFGYALHAWFPPGDPLAMFRELGETTPHELAPVRAQKHMEARVISRRSIEKTCDSLSRSRDSARSFQGSLLLQSTAVNTVGAVDSVEITSHPHQAHAAESSPPEEPLVKEGSSLDEKVSAVNRTYPESLQGGPATTAVGRAPTFQNSVTVVSGADGTRDAYVAIPFYSHGKQNIMGIGELTGSDILGDALEPTSHGAHHGHIALLFLFGCLAIGSTILILLERFCPTLPYTCALFAAGFLVSIVHFFQPEHWWTHWPTWFASVSMWDGINPHLIFYAFLPALIFGESMRVSVQLVERCFWQVFLLACPAVIVGTVFIATFCKYVLPYGWDWPISLVFGSILCATDPVAVVALFHTLGVSPRLTMLISGESMLNDGTAVVLFQLCLKVALGATFSFSEMVVFFGWMTVVAMAFGALSGNVAVVLIGWCAEEHYSNDSMIQVVVTICCGYLTFFLAEHQLETSGVIATVTAGFTMAFWAWPRFVSRETMRTVWEAIEFIGNTLIFFLAGLIWGNIVLSRWGLIGLEDVGWLFVIYAAIMVVRGVIMGLFWVPLNLVGTPLSWKEGVVMTWSGLRGAVSLALAIIVDIEPDIDRRRGSRVMFLVGGIAALTFLFNSTTAARLLSALGMTKTTQLRERMLAHFKAAIASETKKEFQQMKNAEDIRFRGACEPIVKKMVPALESPDEEPEVAERVANVTNDNNQTERDLQRIYREVLLKFVQNFYWEAIEEGIIPRTVKVTRILLHSTDEALDNSYQSLNDWDIIARDLNMDPPGVVGRLMAKLVDTWPLSWIPEFKRTFSTEFRIMRKVFGALCYMEAHTMAVKHVLRADDKTLLDDMEVEARARLQVRHESEVQCAKAADLLEQQKPEDVQIGRSEMLARKLLTQQAKRVEALLEAGQILHAEASDMEHKIYHAVRQIVNLPKESWREMLRPDSGEAGTRNLLGLGLPPGGLFNFGHGH